MTTKEELLEQLWDRINSYVVQDDLDEIVERSNRLPDEPFADAGAAIVNAGVKFRRRAGAIFPQS
jgi:hypothetical protein